MLHLKTVIQGVTETVRPMKKRQRAQHKKVQSHQGKLGQREQVSVTGCLYPTQRKCQSKEQQVHGDQDRSDHPSGAEECPEESFVRLLGHCYLKINHATSAETTSHIA